MSSYFDRLDEQLRRVADPTALSQVPTSFGRRAWSWVASHVAVTIAAVVVTAGVASAGGALLAGTPSRPAHGSITQLPATTDDAAQLDYRVSVSPLLDVGRPGWCTMVWLRRSSRPERGFGGGGCGPASAGEANLSGGGTITLGGERGTLAFAVVGKSVAYGSIRGGSPVTPVADPALPNGWRAIIVQARGAVSQIQIFDATHKPLKRSPADVVSERRSRGGRGEMPASAPCSITPPYGVHAIRSRWLEEVEPSKPTPVGKAFLACAQTRVRYRGEIATVTTLVDAGTPYERAGKLPGARTLTGGDVEYRAGDSLSDARARRVGNGWLVVVARTSKTRRAVLAAADTRTP